MSSFEQRVIGLFEQINPLDRVSRAGFVLRGVTQPESVAAHSHFVSLMALIFLEAHPNDFDLQKTLTMALIHDLPEAVLMDIPMPAADAHFRTVKDEAEQAVTERLFEGFSSRFAQAQREFLLGKSPEARLVRGLDKAQMMMKITMYEREGQGRLAEFWENPKNFADYGLKPVSDLFDAICAEAGRTRPMAGEG